MPRLAQLCAALLLAVAAHAHAAGLSLNIGDFNADDWAVLVITDEGQAELGMAVAPDGGNPGSHWVIGYVKPRLTGWYVMTDRLSAFYTPRAYDPAQAGALQKMAFGLDITSLFSTFSHDYFGQIQPALLQDGVAYTTNLHAIAVQQDVYRTIYWAAEAVATDWESAIGGNPDFSAGAAPIYVGFSVFTRDSCHGIDGCLPVIAFNSVDNFSATLTPVPEPAAWLLLPAGLALLALRRRPPC